MSAYFVDSHRDEIPSLCNVPSQYQTICSGESLVYYYSLWELRMSSYVFFSVRFVFRYVRHVYLLLALLLLLPFLLLNVNTRKPFLPMVFSLQYNVIISGLIRMSKYFLSISYKLSWCSIGFYSTFSLFFLYLFRCLLQTTHFKSSFSLSNASANKQTQKSGESTDKSQT